MPAYIEVPIDTDPQDVAQDAYDFLSSVIPGWNPNVPNLDVWIIQALATAAAESRDVASRVPTSIFRWFGATLVGIQPIDASAASVTARFTVQDNLGYTIPANTIIGVNSTGTDQEAFQTLADVVINPGSTFADIIVVAVSPGVAASGLGGVGVAATLLSPLSFVTTVLLQGVTSGGVDAEDDTVYLNRLAAQLTLLAPRPILPADFAIFARNIAGVYRATAIDGYNPFHNLLTADEASIETSAANWQNWGNATVARSVAQAADGAASLALTAVAAGTMGASLTVGATKAVSPGETITAIASFRANTTVRQVQVAIEWINAANAAISQTFGGLVNDTNTGFTQNFVTGVAPAGTAKARIVVLVAAPAAGEIHYADKMSMRRGITTDWVAGGTADTGNPRTISVAAIDTLGNPVSAAVKNAIDADLQARREVNFLIYEVDPSFTSIDVTYQVVARTGYDKVALLSAINAALTSYLSPANWGANTDDPQAWANTTTLRYLELASVINNVDGVDYITTTGGNYDLTTAIHLFALARVDIVLPGAAPLPTAGTITGTVL